MALTHAKEDKDHNLANTAFLVTGLSAFLLSPLIGGSAGIAVSAILGASKKELSPQRIEFLYESDFNEKEKDIYKSIYKKELSKVNSYSAGEGATGGCCLVWFALILLISIPQ